MVSAREIQVNGEKLPFITIDTGTTLASLQLSRYYHNLVKELVACSHPISDLTLRVYHLPAPPTIVEYRGRPLHRYQANSYTLAILEPDTLLNITDLNHAEYCARQYLLNRLVPSPTSAAAIRGNLVHTCFKELLKEHDRGELMTNHAAHGEETTLAALHRHLAQALARSSVDLALANVSTVALHAEIVPHLESLATWFENQRATLWDMPASYDEGEATGAEEQRSENMVRAETFLLAPEIGLKGRLDLLWRQSSRQRLLELKTGGSTGQLPRANHRWQVYGYHALLTVRRDSRMKKALATLLYSGTPGQAQAFGIPFSVRELQRVNEKRNILVLSHVTGTPPAPPGPSRCTRCVMLEQCQRISSLLDWQPPEPDIVEEDATGHNGNDARGRVGRGPAAPLHENDEASPQLQDHGRNHDEHDPAFHVGAPRACAPPHENDGVGSLHEIDMVNTPLARVLPGHAPDAPLHDREFFAKYYRLLGMEGREGEQQQALLWKTAVIEHIERGTAISGLKPLGRPQPTGQGEWLQAFACTNTSELRVGDEVLLSDGNPTTGDAVTGSIMSISAEQVTIWTPELISKPSLIDRYGTDVVHVRTVQNLVRWLQADTHLRELVSGKARPRFSTLAISTRADFNAGQNLAVERALQMQDYLLVHGPPGTGKTSVIAEIVKRLCQQGQRVLLAAFTNQAVDNMLKRLNSEGFHDYVRLGHDRSVDEAVQERLLKNVALHAQGAQPASSDGLYQETRAVREILRKIPVVASTTATWSSDKYAPASIENAQDDPLLQFDVALIDEAGQLTIPAILGALRFTKRFILVGDEKQLPPLVLSKEAAQAGLADSLFNNLKRLDDDYRKEQPEAVSASVSLRTQYRMNEKIAGFASQFFYEGQLQAHPSVAKRVLEFTLPGGPLPATESLSIMRAIRPGHPLVFLDVGSETRNSQPKTSNSEARAVRDIVAALLARGIAPRDIGIIAPYRAQVANLRRYLFSSNAARGWQALPFDSPMSIDTVDRFQGGERPVIIMSFATAQPPDLESPLRTFLTDPHRLNVALTRAQRKLILVGCASALQELPVFRELLTYCRELGTLLNHKG